MTIPLIACIFYKQPDFLPRNAFY